MIRTFNKLIRPYAVRIRSMVVRATITLVNDQLKAQGLQVKLLAGEVADDVEHFQEYGFTSHPHRGAEGIALTVLGDRSHTVVIAVGDRRYRLKGLAEGEVAMYTDEGDYFLLQRGNKAKVKTDELSLGPENPTDFVALASLVAGEFAAIRAHLTTLKGATAAIATAVDGIIGGTPAINPTFVSATALVPGAPSSVASTYVKAE